MASTEKRGRTVHEAVLEYCTFWTQALYRQCWPKPHEVNPDATTEEKKAARLAVAREMMPMLRHEIPASALEPTQEPVLLTGNLGSDSEPEIMAGSFLGTYGVLAIDTAGHWTYHAGKARLREITENGPDWFAHYDRFFVTHEDGFVQMLTISLCRRRNAEVEKTKASATVGDRVPGGTFGENNEPDLRLAMKADFASKLPDPDPFEEPAPVPLWVEGKPGDGMPRRKATQDELRHLRFYPERDKLSGGGLRFEGLLFFNEAERDRRAIQGRQAGKKSSGPKTPVPPPKKRGGGLNRGPYYGKLKKHLKWRKDEKDDLVTASLRELREDARRRLITDGVMGIPRTRSGLEDAIKAALRDLGVDR